jgi:hypothetical protein
MFDVDVVWKALVFFIKEDAPGIRKEGLFLPVLFYKY